MDLRENLKRYLSKEEIDDLFNSFNKSEQKGFLLNENKLSKQELIKLFPNVISHSVVKNGYLFDKNTYELGKSIYHEAGAIYIQDPSAMLVSYFLSPSEDDVILDMCASPGGKTIGASLLMHNKGLIVANDLSKSRAINLLSNVERMGLGNVMVTSLDFSKIYKDYIETFDAIILDAPCSGSGMFRKSEEMKKDWNIDKVYKNAIIQKELINIAYKMLKKGGKLIYSTCSYSYEEDEEIVDYLLANSDAISVPLPDFEGEYKEKNHPNCVHLFPSKFMGEGQFIALFKKPGELIKSKNHQIEIHRKVTSKGNESMVENYLLNSDRLTKLANLALRPGLFVSTTTKDKTIPSHHYSHYIISSETIINLDYQNIQKYIRGESLKNIPYKNGYYFVSYNNLIIGNGHLVNNELKNLYPKGLRKNLK